MSSFGYARLAERVLAGAPSELLDAPLDRLQDDGADEDALELLRSACEQGEADTLRALLGEGRLERFIDSTCTAREEERLCAQLVRWAERPPSPLDDPERLVAELEPPRDRDELGAWAREHGVAAQLASLEALYPRGGRAGAGLLGRHDHDDELREALSVAARTALSGPRREALWARAPTPLLRTLAERLRAVLGDTPLAALAALRFDARRPVRIDAQRSRAEAQLQGRAGHAHVALVLSGYEARALGAECSCGESGCLHVKALAARLYDACVAADDRLHPELVAFCRVPGWRRFLEAAEGTASAKERPRGARFRLRQAADGGLELAVLAAKDGRIASAKQLLRGPHAPEDVPVLEALAQRARSAKASWERVDLGLLQRLVEHPRLELDDTGHALSVHEERVELSLEELPEGIRPGLFVRGQALRGAPEGPAQRFVWQLDPATSQLFFAELSPALVRFWGALGDFRGVLPKESFAGLGRLVAGLRSVADVALPKALLGHERPAPRTLTLYVSRAPTEGLFCSLSMSPLPLGAPWPPGRGPELVHGLVDGVTTHTRRDLAWEREAALRIETALGLQNAQRTGPHAYYVPDEQAALGLLDAAARHHHELQVAWAEPARALVSAGTLRPGQLSIRMFKKGDWFGLSGRQRGEAAADLPLATLFEAVRRGERYVKIDGTHYAEIAEELRERLLRVEPMVQLSKAEPSLAQSAVPRAAEALGGDEVELDPAARALVQAEARRDTGELDLPPTLVPRDYQRAGIAFLVQRSRWASGVCLADEMGLGKTVQTIALLWLRRGLGPQIVIAPTSVLSNWESELKRFAPALRVVPYGGAARRERLEQLGPSTVLVASYDVILRDRTALVSHTFATQVIDEAQFVKNARTERFRAVAALAADFRVALSGTPIENRTGDLYSLFVLIAPGLLGSWQRFRARFAVPIERYDDRERARLLRELVAPFILRREKSAVARELPERTEVVHRIELSAPERDLYDAAARAAREALDLRGRSERVPRLKVLAELTRLRQLACHPRLVLGADATASSKLRALLALLDDLLPRGHRALLFSQFTRHLELVREALDARGVHSLTLIGETPAAERKARVDAFQAGSAPVFLISLRAGGAGLNLTAADYVIHLDPWWNPAAEDQASDRAHRIGQLRPVTVVKLVAEDTIEEKVLGLHGHKRRLFAQLFDDQPHSAGPDDAELFEELFRDAQSRAR